jgi:hypothetical protein
MLSPLRYDGFLIIIIIDFSLFAAGWEVGQDNEEYNKFVVRYKAKIFIGRKRLYAKVKNKLWDAKIALKQDKNHLIGAYIRLENRLLAAVADDNKFFCTRHCHA